MVRRVLSAFHQGRRKAGGTMRASCARSYLLKRHTTSHAWGRPATGVITLFCIGLACGVGTASVPPAEAHALGAMPQGRALSVDGSPSHLPTPGISRSLPAQEDNPLRIIAGDRWSVPPLIVLPMRGTPTSPTASAGIGGRGDVPPPASQAHTIWATVPEPFGRHALLAGQPAYNGAFSRGPGLAAGAPAPHASVIQAAGTDSTPSTPGVTAASPARSASGTHLSALGLERTLDSQPSLPGASLPLALRPDGTLGDLTAVKQRPANAAGLKLRVAQRHPAHHRPRHAAHASSQNVATPQPTATTASYAQAAYVTTPTPTPTPLPTPAASTNGASVCATPNSTARTFYITGYLPTGNPTASGVMPHPGTVAIDPRVIPMGSIVCIQGMGQFHAEDTGGAIQGNRIDVFETSLEAAYAITGYRLAWWIPD